jgi:nucleoside-diphosphate-sugar epimerase
MSKRILVIGSLGQIGTELVEALKIKYGEDHIVSADIKDIPKKEKTGIYETLNVLNAKRLYEIIHQYNVEEVYLLAALLSATAEANIKFAWDLNMNGLFNVLDLAKEKKIKKVFWPSSIAVFGPNSPKINTPQYTVMEPSTVYGISKQSGERWCEYYSRKFEVDVRSLRYPGLIGYKSPPGGGTTDYAVHIFYEAIKNKTYTSFLSQNTRLPMMYMPDAIKATLSIMDAPKEKIKIKSSYNLTAFDFTPHELATEIQKFIPDFTIQYAPDHRQTIADSWPQSIDDSHARNDWGWQPDYTLQTMVKDMIENLKQKL